MKKALDFLNNGEQDGRWDKLKHPSQHPYYNNNIYDGNDFVILEAIRIAYLEGQLEEVERTMEVTGNYLKDYVSKHKNISIE